LYCSYPLPLLVPPISVTEHRQYLLCILLDRLRPSDKMAELSSRRTDESLEPPRNPARLLLQHLVQPFTEVRLPAKHRLVDRCRIVAFSNSPLHFVWSILPCTSCKSPHRDVVRNRMANESKHHPHPSPKIRPNVRDDRVLPRTVRCTNPTPLLHRNSGLVHRFLDPRASRARNMEEQRLLFWEKIRHVARPPLRSPRTAYKSFRTEEGILSPFPSPALRRNPGALPILRETMLRSTSSSASPRDIERE